MVQLLEIAAARAKTAGVSTADAFNFLVTGIGRGSTEILDNINILLDNQQVMSDYANSIGVTVEQLSKAERTQAVFNAVVASSRDIVEANATATTSSAEAFEHLAASAENARARLGEFLAPATAEGASALARGLDLMAEGLERMQGASLSTVLTSIIGAASNPGNLTGMAVGISRIADESMRAGESASAASGQISAYSTIVDEAALAQDRASASASALGGQIAALAGTYPAAASGMAQYTDSANQLAAANYRLALAQKTAIQSIASGLVKNVGAAGALDFVHEQTSALAQQVGDWREIGASTDDIANVLIPSYVSGLRESVSEVGKIPESVSKAQQAFESLKGRVAGLLSGALDTGTGVDPESILGRQDAINEDARRLADVAVKGFDSPWASYLNDKFPELFKGAFAGGDLKTAAATALQDFQDGLRPELLDRDRAKERVRRMILGEQRLGDLAKEIATELSQEMGAAAPGDLIGVVNQSLGLTPDADAQGEQGRASGAAFRDGMLEGLTGGNIGAEATRVVSEQLRAEGNLNQIKAAGRTVGSSWGSGFLETVGASVPQRLIDLLVSLITPGVQANLRTQASLTGAN
jgi:hypothetical protein